MEILYFSNTVSHYQYIYIVHVPGIYFIYRYIYIYMYQYTNLASLKLTSLAMLVK